VNPSADSELKAEVVAAVPAGRNRFYVGLIVAAMLLYPALRTGTDTARQTMVAAMALAAVAYVLGIYLYYGIASLAYRRYAYLLWFGGVGGAVIGYLVTGLDEIWLLICGWSMVFLPGVIMGRMAAEGRRRLTVYLAGAGLAAVFAVALYAPKWAELMHMATALGSMLIQDFTSNLQASGYSAEMVKEYTAALQKLLDVTIRLTPASLLMSGVAQFSIGYLWFYGSTARSNTEPTPMESFILWKMPFAVTGAVIVGTVLRLIGGETITMVADNLLAVLAIFYCVTGLALIEFYMRRLGLPRFMRILFYLLLFFTQLAGFIVTVLLGFVDGFADWRKVGGAKTSFENENGSLY